MRQLYPKRRICRYLDGKCSNGRAPKPLPGTRRWDRKAIDLALDKVSGIAPPSADSEADEYTTWKQGYAARKAARELDPEYVRKKRREKPL
jgi:hypothetical protein